jgi:hypothetical protein
LETDTMTEREIPPPAHPANPANGLAPLEGLAEGQPPATRDTSGRFLTGNNGGGRPKGAKNKLTDLVLSVIIADFEEHGAATVAQLRKTDPEMYLRLVSALVPREMVLRRERELDFWDMSLEEIEGLIKRAGHNQRMRRRLAELR